MLGTNIPACALPRPPGGAIRIGDLGSLDKQKVPCLACSHVTRVYREYLERHSRTEPNQPIASLQRRLACSRCQTVGYVELKVEWYSQASYDARRG